MSFNFSIRPSNEYSVSISFRIDWFDLLAVQGTLESLLQHHSWKASIFQCSAFLLVQLSHPYVATRKTIALTIQTFISKVMSLLFHMLLRFITAFCPRSKRLLISWLLEAGDAAHHASVHRRVCPGTSIAANDPPNTRTHGNLIPDAYSLADEDAYLHAGFSRAHSQTSSLRFTWEP